MENYVDQSVRHIRVNSKWVVNPGGKFLCRVVSEIEGALIYNKYVTENNLGIPLNMIEGI